MNSSLGPVVGYWIEMVPKRRRPSKGEMVKHIDRCNGLGDKEKPEDMQVMMQVLACLVGCGDNRQEQPHIYGQSLPIWPTRRSALAAAKGLANDSWGTRVRLARLVGKAG